MSYMIPTDADLLEPTLDVIFKSLFTKDIPESRLALKALLTSIIGIEVVEVTLTGNEPPVDMLGQIQTRLDLTCRFNDGHWADLEMQMNYNSELINRVEYYVCDLFSSQGLKGQGYFDPKHAYQIAICNATVFPKSQEFFSHYQFKNDKGSPLSDNVHIYFIELTKLDTLLKKSPKSMSPLEKWAFFFEYVDHKEYRNKMNEIIETEEGIKMASELLQTMSKSDEERINARQRKKAILDYETETYKNNLIKTENLVLKQESEVIKQESDTIKQENEAIKQENEAMKQKKLLLEEKARDAYEKGRFEANLALAKSLVGLLPDEVIAEKSGLDLDEITKIKDALSTGASNEVPK